MQFLGARATRSLPRSLAGAAGKASAITVALVASYVGTAVVSDLTNSTADAPVREYVDPASILIAEKRCSTTGFRNSEIPASAVVRTRDGELRHVSFDKGWAVYEGRAPGILVAVCRAPLG